MSSKRLPTWTTWPSCMRAGLPGCECYAASRLWSSEGLEIHQSPVGLGCPNSSSGPHWGEEMGSGCLVLPPKLGQRPRSTAATTLPQPSAIGLTQRLVGLRPHLPFWGLTRQSSAEWGRGEESHDLFTLDSEIPPPLTCIAHYQVVPINISASF